MRPLRYSINVTLDGCVDHRAGSPDEEIHQHYAESIARADGMILGRVTYQMMEEAWRPPLQENGLPEWMEPFAASMRATRKYVVSTTLRSVDWNAELISGDVVEAVRRLKQQPGAGLHLGGVMLPLALARADLIDEYEFVVHPTVAGHGPYLLAGLDRALGLRATGSRTFGGGAIATTYVPTR
jgi:dihydrofolate reductase